MRLMIKDAVRDFRRMILDFRLDCKRSDDLKAVKRILLFLLKRGKAGVKQLFGTGIGFILILTLLYGIIPRPSFSSPEAEPEPEQTVESASEGANAITAKAKAPKPRDKKPVDWDAVVGFVFLVVVSNVAVMFAFWRKDRKKLTPEMIQKRLKDEDAQHRERRRNILFDLLRSQGLDLRSVPNREQLADDVAKEVSDGDLENTQGGE